MAKQHPWQVGQHTELEQLDDDLWRVAAEVPPMPLARHMTVVRLESGALLIHNAVCLDEPSMAALEALGPPTYLIVPSHYRLDAFAFKQRCPALEVFTPAPSRHKVEKVVAVSGSFSDLPSDSHLHVRMLDVGSEGVVIYTNAAGENTLIFNDTLFNLPKRLLGFRGLVVRMMGSTGGPKVTRISKMRVASDRHALAAHLHRLAQQKLRCIIPGHGELIREHAAQTLTSVAQALSPRAIDG